MKTILRGSICVLFCLAFALSISAQLSMTIQPTEEDTPMRQYRELAERAHGAYLHGESTKAVEAARALEAAWDEGSGNVRTFVPDLWTQVDESMDVFIKPLIGSAVKPVDAQAEKAAYESFRSELEKADRSLSDDSLAARKTKSGVVVIVTNPSSGRQPKRGEILVWRMVGIANGREFRRTTEGDPNWMWFPGEENPPGFVEGLSELHVGESAILIVPPGLGYGSKGGRNGAVPPNAVLTYFVQVLDVKSHEMGQLLLKTIDETGVDGAVDQFETLRRQGFPDEYCNERQINGVGYRLLEHGDKEGAIKVLRLNEEIFPASANVYDSLGDAYASSGNKELAVENYEKALSLDPKMESSIKALRLLKGDGSQ
jgi:FKBP-type peptidyl-prolyl cis-trans isomerase